MAMLTLDSSSVYHEVHGTGDPVLLLHGGFCSLEMMRPQLESLAADYEVHAVERPGHGRSADVGGAFSYDQSVTDTLAYLDAVGVIAPHIVGFSDGAIIGLLMGIRHPDRVRSLVAISGNLDPSGFRDTSGDPQDEQPGPDRTREWYNKLSPDGPEHADYVVARLMELWTTEPQITPADLAAIAAPTLIMAGDRDVIAPDHTRLIVDGIPDAQLCIVPGTGHGLIDEKPDFVTYAIRDFLARLG